jgi:hypothetical protein
VKTLILFSVLLILAIGVHSQSHRISFDGESWDEAWRISADSTNPPNIWQIGKPQKPFFDCAYSYPRAIVTATILNYPPHNYSIFYLFYFPSSSGLVAYYYFQL